MDIYIDPFFKKYYQSLPLTLVDVGVSGGIQKRWKRAGQYLRVVGFEPDERSMQELNPMASARHIYLSSGLYKERGVLPLYQTKTKTDSSLLKPNKDFLKKFPKAERFEVIATTTINVDTLDAQLSNAKIRDVDFIKIDTQGSELSILQGSSHILQSSVFGVEVEVEFATLYEDQALFTDVEVYLRHFGFQLFDLAPVYWKRKIGKSVGRSKGQIIYADALFLRDPKYLTPVFAHFNDLNEKKTKFLKAISICILYGYLDFALELVEYAGDTFTAQEQQIINASIWKQGRVTSPFSFLPGRKKIAHSLRRLAGILHPDPQEWRMASAILGNREE